MGPYSCPLRLRHVSSCLLPFSPKQVHTLRENKYASIKSVTALCVLERRVWYHCVPPQMRRPDDKVVYLTSSCSPAAESELRL